MIKSSTERLRFKEEAKATSLCTKLELGDKDESVKDGLDLGEARVFQLTAHFATWLESDSHLTRFVSSLGLEGKSHQLLSIFIFGTTTRDPLLWEKR